MKFLWTSKNYYKEKIKKLQIVVLTIGPAKSNGLMVVFCFSYELIGVRLHNSFKRHYTLPYVKDGQ